jgi:hypothetical protein
LNISSFIFSQNIQEAVLILQKPSTKTPLLENETCSHYLNISTLIFSQNIQEAVLILHAIPLVTIRAVRALTAKVLV